MNSKGSIIFWAIIACLLWSTAYAGIKFGLKLIPGALGAVVYGAQPLIIAVVAAILHKDDKLTLQFRSYNFSYAKKIHRYR